MIEAGVSVFLDSYPETGAGDRLDREMVRDVFIAMRHRARMEAAQAPRGR